MAEASVQALRRMQQGVWTGHLDSSQLHPCRLRLLQQARVMQMPDIVKRRGTSDRKKMDAKTLSTEASAPQLR